MQLERKKILIITPKFPLPDIGACEKDRLQGMIQMKRLGYDVQVIAKVFEFQDQQAIRDFEKTYHIPIHLVPYERQGKKSLSQKILFNLKRFLNPLYIDGAAYEYSHASIQKKVQDLCDRWKPDLVWFEYTYLWPLYHIPRSRNIPIITRSINFEPHHFLEEDGYTFLNYIKFVPKLISEYLSVKKSHLVLSITPKEAKTYQKLTRTPAKNLPLRGLPDFLAETHDIPQKPTLDVFFMGSSYTVAHNLRALEFILKEIIPEINRQSPRSFNFFILGKKVPENLKSYIHGNVHEAGYIKDTRAYISKMDIALIPSLFGAGMQQKIFEPLCMGVPTVVSPRGIAEYPFENNIHYLSASTAEEFVSQMLRLKDSELRKKLSKNSIELAHELFSRDGIDTIVQSAIKHG
jgi:glycosyltransferase involved in cell wall biosynthesis